MEPNQAFLVLVNTARLAQSTGKPSLEDAEQILQALRVVEKALNERAELVAKTAPPAPVEGGA